MPAARARAAIALTSPPSLFGSSQIHIPLPANGAGSGPPGARRARGTGSTTSRIARDRRPARSVTRTEIVPALVPGGTRATHPVGERLSLVASAPFDQRKLTRIPALRPVPAKLDLLADHDLRARVADGARRGHASQPGQLRRGRARLGGRRARARRRAGSRSRGCVRAASSVTTDRTPRSRAGAASAPASAPRPR